MSTNKRILRRTRKLGEVVPYRSLGCPLTHSRTPWCHRICRPIHGRGVCGRIAPHTLRSRIQRSIDQYKALQAQKLAEASILSECE